MGNLAVQLKEEAEPQGMDMGQGALGPSAPATAEGSRDQPADRDGLTRSRTWRGLRRPVDGAPGENLREVDFI